MKKFLSLSILLCMTACFDDPGAKSEPFDVGENEPDMSNNINNATNNGNNANNSNNVNNSNNTNNSNNVNNTNNTNNSNNSNNTNNSNNSNNTNNTNNTIVVESCSDPVPPPRCAEDPDNFVWDAGSVWSELQFSGSGDFGFDQTGDGIRDNGFGAVLDAAGLIQQTNAQLAGAISSGTFVAVFEYQGLTAVDSATDFRLNVYQAFHENGPSFLEAGNNPMLLDPASIDMGTQPKHFIPNGELVNGSMTAGIGTVQIEFDLFGLPLDLTIYNAQLAASVDATMSSLTDGLRLEGGVIGGAILIEDIYASVNEIAATCACLGINTPLIEAGSCAAGDSAACQAANRSECAAINDNCNSVTLLELFADVDVSNDNTPDALSVGLSLETVGAAIQGIAP